MEEKELGDYLAALRRYRKPFNLIFFGLLGVSLAVAVFWPPVYRSTATILIEEQEIPPEMVRSTITSFAAQRLQTINQRVMTRANLLGIIEKYGLYADERKKKTTDEVLEDMRDDITFQTISADVIDPRSGHPTMATIAFSLSFDSRNPAQAQQITNEITNLYLEENLKNRTQQTAEATNFLRAEVEQVAANAANLERKLAAFKEAHIDALPEQKPLITQSMERTENELKEIQIQIRAMQERALLLDSQLASVPKESPVYDSGERVGTASQRLKALRTAYVGLVARYSDKHPDVQKMRQEIIALERSTGNVDASSELAKQLSELQAERSVLRDKYSAGHPDVQALDKRIAALETELANARVQPSRTVERLADSQADNPAYLSLLAQRETNAVEIAGLQQRRDELRAKLQNYERRLQRTPEVERQYLELARDWENATLRHRDLKAKLMEAEIAEQLERKSKGEHFSVVEPPMLPERPIKPNRPLLAALGLVLALAGAFGYVLLRETLDLTLRKPGQVAALAGAVPLAVIPLYDPQARGPERLRHQLVVLGWSVATVVVVLALVHWLWLPLDVLWFRGLRRLDTLMG